MRIALLAPLPWRLSPADHASWGRVVAVLAAGLGQRGHEVLLLEPPDGDADGGASDALEALLLRSLGERAGELDLVHNHAGLLPLLAAPEVPVPMISTLPGLLAGDALAAWRSLCGRTMLLASDEALRPEGLELEAAIAGGLPPEDYAAAPRPAEHLVLVGGPHPEEVAAQAHELARAAGRPLVDPTGLPHAERVGILASAHAALAIGPHDPPFWTGLIEAAACGVPAVAPDRPATRAIVEPGSTGWLHADAAQALDALRRVAELDRSACRAHFERRFTLERMVDDHLRVYEARVASARRERADRAHDRRPWGEYWVLENAEEYKVKRIDVLPGKRLSYQRHTRRSEHWMVVRGNARVTLDGQEQLRGPGDVVDIPAGTAHRIENVGPETMSFVEIQRGSYFGEDDIERLEDDFGRTRA